MFLLEPAGSIQAAVTHPSGQDGDQPLPAAPLLDHQCNYFGNFFDGRYQANVNNTGARARIGHPGSAPVNICNPVAGGNPASASSSWAMMDDLSCAGGYFQVGYARRNDHPDLDPLKEYFFTEYKNCDAVSNFRWLGPVTNLGGTSHCYTVTFSGLRQRWYADISATCGGTWIAVWSLPASAIDINANSVQYFGEVFDFLQAPGANGHNSDSMCGFSYNKCTWQQTQRRSLAGVWSNASTTGFFTPGGHCGYGQVVNNPTSFAIWTNFSGC